MYQPDQGKGNGSSQSSASHADGRDLELGQVTGGKVRNGGCAEALRLVEQLGGDEEVAKVLEEAMVVGATDS